MKKLSKKILFIGLFIGGIVSASAQDIIVKKDGNELQAKVTEIGETSVKYKKFENLDGPVYTLNKSEVFMIKYQNGEKDVFAAEQTPQAPRNQWTSSNQSGFAPCLHLRRSSTTRILNTLQESDNALYKKFRTGNALNKAGTGLLIPGCVLAGTGLICMFVGSVTTYDSYYSDGYAAVVAGGVLFGVGGTLAITAIPLKVVGKKMKRSAVDSYNSQYCNRSSDIDLKLNLYGNGAGLAIGF